MLAMTCAHCQLPRPTHCYHCSPDPPLYCLRIRCAAGCGRCASRGLAVGDLARPARGGGGGAGGARLA
eukprot:scaffold19403_cov66-Phaeocystis_antarctica.AAC.7